jgi:mRNA-degrading endonuclease toxin of MazEF toxin-antitoxin module
MKRGEVWTVSGGKDYAGKPRPAVIMQDDSFDATYSITHLRLHHRPGRCSKASTSCLIVISYCHYASQSPL